MEQGIPAGYKQTEVGVIPDGWVLSTVGDEFEVELGKMLDAAKNVGTPKPYIGNRAVQWSRIDVSELGSVRLTSSDLTRYRLEVGDLLVCEGGEVGRAAIWDAPIAECYYQKALHRLRSRHGYDARLMQALLHLWATRGDLADEVTQTSIAHLPREKLVALPLPVPPQQEQRAIADALGDVDALLDAQNRLLAKQRDLKQAAMQQLLTGRTRLPGFTGKWQRVAFGDVAQIRNTKVVPTSASIGTRCVELDNLSHSTGRLLGTIDAVGATAKYAFLAGDVLFGRLRAYLRKYWLATFDGLCSTEIWPLVPRDDRLHNTFLHLIVQTDRFVEAAGISYGTHMPRSDWTVLCNFEVKLPTVSEQTAIAAVLSDLDAEIAALEARRAKTCDLKQAMLQELLTGRTRLA